MASTVIDSQVFSIVFTTQEMQSIFSDQSLVQKWLDVEAALARAQGEIGVIPKNKADQICALAKAELLDIPAIGELFKSSITMVPFLKVFKSSLPKDVGEFIHWGATSQDIFDTGFVLMQREAYRVFLRDLKLCLQYCLDLAQKYRNTVMAGRTHVVHAVPITFGYKVAIWADELGRAIQRLEELAPRVFVGQLSGAVGTLATMPEVGLEVQKRTLEILNLEVPNIAWHVARDGQAEFVNALALCAGTIGRIAHEIFTLQRTEILELEEPYFVGKVGSSTMPHKRNPAVLENVLALCRNVRGIAPTIVEAMINENERDWSCLISEWEAIPRVCHLFGAALEKTKDILKNLIVYPEHMERNLFAQKGLMMSEHVMMILADKLGRMTAHDVVMDACMIAYENETSLKEVMMTMDVVRSSFNEEEVDKMLDPHAYVGLSGEFVDRVLKHYRH